MPKHKFTQEDINGRVIAGTHHVDEVNIINELRKIIEDLAVIVGQVKLGDGNYPADGTTGVLANNLLKNNYSAVGYPTMDDDETKGYSIGSHWLGAELSDLYILFCADVGHAIWKRIPAGGIENRTAKSILASNVVIVLQK